jgi:hypothetical protein
MKGFIMNPIWYLATIPLIALYYSSIYLAGYLGIIIFITVFIALLTYLNINNIIGTIDAILLFFILVISYDPLFLGPTSVLLNFILIPLAIGLSYNAQK